MILTVNAGSSSLKFALYDGEATELAAGLIERIGPNARMRFEGTDTDIGAADHSRALSVSVEALGPHMTSPPIGVGHRVVHGGTRFDAPLRVTDDVLAELTALEPLAPLHQPHNLSGLRAAQRLFPDAIQVACFDTAFHRSQPWVNDVFAIPLHFYEDGVRRYGFHGLSYDYITSHLAAAYPELHAGRVVVAHLGNGASLCGVREGQAQASTMGFSALDGLPMGTRCGQIDPGVLLYLMGKGMDAHEMSNLLYHESGLKGLSGVGSDMRELLESDDPRAARAIEHYCFRVRREIGAMSAALGGLDGLVFTGGIGENAAPIRAMICEGLDFLGVTLDPQANASGGTELGTGTAKVLRIPTDEEGTIARAVQELVVEG